MSGHVAGGGAAVHTYPGTLYEYTAGVCCGVFVSENVMRKLAALQAQHLESVRRVLHDNQGEVFPSMWTLHHPDGKQTIVHFIDTNADLNDRIRYASTGNKPQPRFPVFIADSMEAAKEMADARIAARTQP